jgi:hypothetical protein
MEYLDSEQCFSKIWSESISRETIIYDILIIYYFLSTVFAHSSFKSNLKKILIEFNENMDIPSDSLSPKEKFESLISALNFGMKMLYLTVYSVVGIYIKTWAIFGLQRSLTNLNVYFINNNYLFDNSTFKNDYMINGMIIYTIVSFFYDKSIGKKYIGIKILSLLKDMLIGTVIFSNETNIIELIRLAFYLSIRFELTSWLIMLLIN